MAKPRYVMYFDGRRMSFYDNISMHVIPFYSLRFSSLDLKTW